MSFPKKDPSLRVAANEPHLVSLGGGRLSTAVTIHNIPVGDCTIGTSSQCAVSLSGAGVKPIHCTIYRSEENQVTLVPEPSARILVDNRLIKTEIDLRQGAMITIGDSYYLRYNNPAEALQMRSVMEEIIENDFARSLEYFFDSNTRPGFKSCRSESSAYSYYENFTETEKQLEFADWQCPKVFSADLVTVNMPAKDVLGRKYATFSRNLTDQQSRDRSVAKPIEEFDNVISSEHSKNTKLNEKEKSFSSLLMSDNVQSSQSESKESKSDMLEDMLKICAEYADRQDRPYGCSGSTTSSPIVQNRIITNGSLPRDKKSPFCQELQSFNPLPSTSRFENIHILQENSFDSAVSTKCNMGNEYVKYEPKSPLSKIKKNVNSPKTEPYSNDDAFKHLEKYSEKSSFNYKGSAKKFEQKCETKIEPIEESSKSVCNVTKSSLSSSERAKRINKNINNLTIDIKTFVSPCSSPSSLKKPLRKNKCDNKGINTRSLTTLLSDAYYDKWLKDRDDLLKRIQRLKAELSSLQKQDNETLIEMDMEQALIIAKLDTIISRKQKLQNELQFLQQTIYRLEAQRNATRVMEENQQSKLKHSIEMKQDQVEKLKAMLNENPNNACLKEELSSVWESLENDKKSFEDLEFQYLENETEWQAYREDLDLEEQNVNKQIEEHQLSLELCEKEKAIPSFTVSEKQRCLSNRLISLIKELRQCELQFKFLERNLFLKTGSNSSLSDQEDGQHHINLFQTQIKQLYSSQEMLCQTPNNENVMSKSANEKFFNNSQIDFLRNELAIDNQKSKLDNMNSKENKKTCNDKKDQPQLFTNHKELQQLDHQRRKIEGILEKLNLNINTNKMGTIQKDADEKIFPSPNQLLRKENAGSPSFANNTPTSGSSFEHTNKFPTNIANKLSSSTIYNESSSPGGCSTTSYDNKINQQQKKQRPLTRFLPIFSENLNLKEHIELAGHPISLCRHVFLDTYSCRGYLNKLGSTFHTWSKRWFVLDRRRSVLVYYADKNERKPRGGAHFSSINEVYIDHSNTSKSGRTHSTFVVKTKNKTYFLQASSDTAARIWIDVIITGAQGRVDY